MSEDILSTDKIDSFIKHYKVTELHHIGDKSFYKKYTNLLKLHQVITIEEEALIYNGEKVKDLFLKYDKVNSLVKDLFVVSVWLEKVLPELLTLKQSPMPKHLVSIYTVVYYEIVLIEFLKYLIIHPVILLGISNELLIDLIDYCANKFLKPPSNKIPSDVCVKLEINSKKNIEKQLAYLSLIKITQCVSLIELLCENLHKLEINVIKRMYIIHDIPLMIVNLFDNDTWSKIIDGKLYKFYDFNWQPLDGYSYDLSKTEINVLLAMDRLIEKSMIVNYTINNYRKQQLSRLLKHLNDKVVEQIKSLTDLKLWLLLNCSDDNEEDELNETSEVVDATVNMQYSASLQNKYDGKWAVIANNFNKASINESFPISNGFNEFLYNVKKLSDMVNTCLQCFNKAYKKCSKCKQAWYCSRKCQITHWSVHKNVCQI